MRENHEIVLRALTGGGEVRLGDPPNTYRLLDNALCVKMEESPIVPRGVHGVGTRPSSGDPRGVWINTHMRLSVFLRLCEEASEETVLEIATDNGMRAMKSGEMKRRRHLRLRNARGPDE